MFKARLLTGVLAYNFVHVLMQFYLRGEEVKQSMEWLIKRLIRFVHYLRRLLTRPKVLGILELDE